MSHIRIFSSIPPAELPCSVSMDENQRHYLGHVMRLRPGDCITLFDGEGQEASAVILSLNRQQGVLRIDSISRPEKESPLHLTLIQSLPKSDRMDWVIQKSTELGVSEIIPIETERSIVRLNTSKFKQRLEHWRNVMLHACAQSGRVKTPVIAHPLPFSRWLHQSSSSNTHRWILLPGSFQGPQQTSLIHKQHEVLVGPEGGFSEEEVSKARASGFEPWSLGPRIFRTETAGLVALALLQYLCGDLHSSNREMT